MLDWLAPDARNAMTWVRILSLPLDFYIIYSLRPEILVIKMDENGLDWIVPDARNAMTWVRIMSLTLDFYITYSLRPEILVGEIHKNECI